MAYYGPVSSRNSYFQRRESKSFAEKLGFDFLFLVLPAFLLSFWVDKSLDFWLTQANEAPVDCPYWVAFLVALPWPLTLIILAFASFAKYILF